MTETEHQTNTHFSLIGGSAAVDRIVEEFYRRMDALPEARTIRAMHQGDLASTKATLKRYLGEWLGGPNLYSQTRGHPRLRMRHMRFAIGPLERDAWMLCMRGALKDAVPNEGLRKLPLQDLKTAIQTGAYHRNRHFRFPPGPAFSP